VEVWKIGPQLSLGICIIGASHLRVPPDLAPSFWRLILACGDTPSSFSFSCTAVMADALCGPSNALQSFQKHTTVDRTLQQDRLVGRHSPAQVSTLYTQWEKRIVDFV
jgi:hypothetical protein